MNWNGSALPTTFASPGQLMASVAANLIATPSTVSITVSSGGATSAPVSFTVSAGATITLLSPPSTTAGGPVFTLTVNGSGFANGAAVNWNGPALPTTFVSANQLTASVAANLITTPSTVSITVSSGGVTSAPVSFTVSAGATISLLSPPSTTAGGPAFTLTVNGSGFANGASVNWNGSALPTTYTNPGQLTASVAANLIAIPSTVSITVSSGGVTSAPASFTVSAGATISSLSPPSTTAGGSAFTLTVNGSGFANGAAVNWNGSALPTTFVSANQLTASVAANLITTPSTVSITVSSGGVTSGPVSFTVSAGATISSLSPASTTAGGPAFTLTVNGSGFANGASVNWNGSALPTMFASPGQLTASVPANLIVTAATATITVMSGGVTSNSSSFIVAVPGPTITSLGPGMVTAGGSAFTLTVTGAGFAPDATVQWNGSALTTTFVSATQVTAAVPANLIAATGTATITVISGGGTSSALTISIASLVIPTITLTAIQPTAVPTQSVNIGVQLSGAAPVALQGTLSLAFSPLPSGLPVGYADPALQFASGGTVLDFTIPAGATTVMLPQDGAIQQGTVAGDITVSLTRLMAGTTDVTPQVPPTSTVTIPPLPPVIVANSVQIVNLTSTGFIVQFTAYSTPLNLATATFAFAASSGTQINGSSTVSVDMGATFSSWYQSAAGLANGSAFQAQAPFTFSGDPNLLQTVTVTLTNSAGASQPVTGGK
ncbi:MAG TPA: hypothetical protein VKV15_11090 [Bryobacteraceae bacterium]|nr:hypothetical protein [Bryobacteraceae bacterium]